MVVAKNLIFGFVKNYFGVALIEKFFLAPETSLFFFLSKACVIGSKEELFLILSHEWML
jgi:hypothetical protein